MNFAKKSFLVYLVIFDTAMTLSAMSFRGFVSTSRKLSVIGLRMNSGATNDIAKELHVEYPNFAFEIVKNNGAARERLGTLTTPHGVVKTPAFVFCATKAAMKGVTIEMLRNENTQFILSNTYHLMLTPGSELIDKMGGLQKFTGWKGPMLTDSGGYQIFSMGFGSVSNEIKGKRNAESLGWNQTLLNIDENGATFRSYVDGSKHYLTPEKSIEIQRQLGADLIVVLDECTPFNVDKEYTESSMHRSHRWAIRSLEEFVRTASGKQALYGIIQGGVYNDLRDQSAHFVSTNPFFGIAIGGSLGADKKSMHDIVAYTRRRIREDRPIHLLGIGGVQDIFHGVRCGIDTFDCVHPTRLGRHGGALVMAKYWDELLQAESQAGDVKASVNEVMNGDKASLEKQNRLSEKIDFLTRIIAEKLEPTAVIKLGEHSVPVDPSKSGEKKAKKLQKRLNRLKMQRLQSEGLVVREHISLTKAPMRDDPRPIESGCKCYTCQNYSRAYLHHLFKAQEILGSTLVTVHNIHFMNKLMADIREGIERGNLDEVERRYLHPKLFEVSADASTPLSD